MLQMAASRPLSLPMARIMHWTEALLAYVQKPISEAAAAKILCQDAEFVFLPDAYPKGQHHFLVLAKNSPHSSILKMSGADLEFLKRMKAFAVDSCAKVLPPSVFSWLPIERIINFGFHALPSLQPLHMHCISKDFMGAGMKTKQHYNSFASSFFIHAASVLDELSRSGSISALQMTPAHYTNLKNQKLKCVECGYEPANMAVLRTHYFQEHPLCQRDIA